MSQTPGAQRLPSLILETSSRCSTASLSNCPFDFVGHSFRSNHRFRNANHSFRDRMDRRSRSNVLKDFMNVGVKLISKTRLPQRSGARAISSFCALGRPITLAPF